MFVISHFRNFALLTAGLLIPLGAASTALAIEGTELNATVGVWAPLFPTFEVGAASTNSDEIGAIVGLSGSHRFDGYRTSAEAGVFYGDAGDISLFGYEALLRDTWSFGAGDFSAGFGYSQLVFDQSLAGADLETDLQGAKVVAGWETMFGRQPLWLDLGLGLYDLSGTFEPAAGSSSTINKFTSTYSVALKTDTSFWGVAARPVLKLEYLSDLATFQNSQIGTEDGLILSAAIEFRLLGR